jgi:glycosyltransferase involved in cell wall biosynthesis
VGAANPKLSLAMIVKNESRCLGRCLQSVRGVVDEIVVADTGSTDDTIKIAREFGAKISNFEWVDDFAAARNFALRQAAGDWILVLDADEWADETLAGEISAFVRGKPAAGMLKVVSDFRRHNQLLRSQCFIARLCPRGAHFAGRIHEQLIAPLPRARLRGDLWHDGYLENRKSARNMRLLEAECVLSFPTGGRTQCHGLAGEGVRLPARGVRAGQAGRSGGAQYHRGFSLHHHRSEKIRGGP